VKLCAGFRFGDDLPAPPAMPPQIPGQTQMFSILSQLATFQLAVLKIPLANGNFSAKTRTDPGNTNSLNRATKSDKKCYDKYFLTVSIPEKQQLH
jgi:hypothetical protein